METLEEILSHTPSYPSWKHIGIKHHHGLDLMLSSLYSEQSLGIGDFLDLLPLIDWCKKVGFDVIQLLPLFDTGFDPSPYNGCSSLALNPVFLNLKALPLLDQAPELAAKLETLKKYNQTKRVEYQQILAAKLNWLREYYAKWGKTLLALEGFAAFQKAQPWLVIYAVFKALKDRHQSQHWNMWPESLQNPTAELIEKLSWEMPAEVGFYMLLQWLCFEQLRHVKSHACQQHILLKGDIPILISPDSADVWYHRGYFNVSLAAGAGPDYYHRDGQYWGFPLFAWETLENDNYLFWQQRLHYSANFFHLYRIDHAVGFFHIWAIPLDKKPKNGFFLPSDFPSAKIQGEKILRRLLSFSSMLPIAEDLGNVAPEFKKIIRDLGIPGTFVLRWEKEHDPKKFPAIGMSTVSTHDSETLQQWWKIAPTESRLYAKERHWPYEDTLSADYRLQILKESHHSANLFHINLFQEYLALFPELIHSSMEEERINVPGKILETNWSYRFRTSIEEIAAHTGLETCIRNILSP